MDDGPGLPTQPVGDPLRAARQLVAASRSLLAEAEGLLDWIAGAGEGASTAIRRITDKQPHCSPPVVEADCGGADRAQDQVPQDHRGIGSAPPVSPSISLAPRQLELLRLVGKGLTINQIAVRMGIKLSTATNIRQGAYLRLRAHSAAEALQVAGEMGLLDTGDIQAEVEGDAQTDALWRELGVPRPRSPYFRAVGEQPPGDEIVWPDAVKLIYHPRTDTYMHVSTDNEEQGLVCCNSMEMAHSWSYAGKHRGEYLVIDVSLADATEIARAKDLPALVLFGNPADPGIRRV